MPPYGITRDCHANFRQNWSLEQTAQASNKVQPPGRFGAITLTNLCLSN